MNIFKQLKKQELIKDKFFELLDKGGVIKMPKSLERTVRILANNYIIKNTSEQRNIIKPEFVLKFI